MIAHYMPGLGNPMTDLDVIDFNRYCGKLQAVYDKTASVA